MPSLLILTVCVVLVLILVWLAVRWWFGRSVSANLTRRFPTARFQVDDVGLIVSLDTPYAVAHRVPRFDAIAPAAVRRQRAAVSTWNCDWNTLAMSTCRHWDRWQRWASWYAVPLPP